MKKLIGAMCAGLLFSTGAMAGGGEHHGKMKGGEKEAKLQLEQRTEEYEKAWNAKDTKKLSAFYTQGAAIKLADGEHASGSKEIGSLLEKEMTAPEMKDAKVDLTVESVRMVTPEVAVLDLKQNVTGLKPQAGAEPMPSDFLVTVVTKKEGQKWMVESVHASPDMKGMQGVGGSGEQGEQMEQEQPAQPEAQPEEPGMELPVKPDPSGY